MWTSKKRAERVNDRRPPSAQLDEILLAQVLLHPVKTGLIDVIGGRDDKDLGSERMRLHQRLDLRIGNRSESRHG